MGLLMLAATRGTRLEVSASGSDAAAAVEAMAAMFANGFEEG